MGTVFLNSAEFGETVTYTPQGGSPKAITAIVDRGASVDVVNQGARTFPANAVEIEIADNATFGVTTVKERFDQVALRLKKDDPSDTVLVVKRVIQPNKGAWRLYCEA
ncbi:MAG: head-tail joining protein [Nitrospiraceae bacterium]